MVLKISFLITVFSSKYRDVFTSKILLIADIEQKNDENTHSTFFYHIYNTCHY